MDLRKGSGLIEGWQRVQREDVQFLRASLRRSLCWEALRERELGALIATFAEVCNRVVK
jgi:hypothetical protein